MTWEEFLAMPDGERGRAFQQLNPYEDPPIFEAVRLAFIQAYPQCGPPNEVIVGEVGMLGPLNGIGVRVMSASPLRVPSRFMDLPVEKLIKAKNGGWKRAR
jgi:hypothetical protein